MHEVAFLALPMLAAPIYAVRAWAARRRARRAGAVQIGQRLPRWGPLPGADGTFWGPKDLSAAKATAFVFMSNRCPGVKAYDARLNGLAARFGDRGARVVGVNSVPHQLYPNESLTGMRAAATERGLAFAYLKDEHQELQRILGATCTPQAFVVDHQGVLRYAGRIDDAFVSTRATTFDLEDALEAVLAGHRVERPVTNAIGCSIDHAPTEVRRRPAVPREAVA